MPGTIDPQEFGRLQAEVSSLRREVDLLAKSLASISQQLTGIENRLSEANGGWKMLMAIGGASAAFGATVGPIVPKLLKLLE